MFHNDVRRYTVANFGPYPIRRCVTFVSALESEDTHSNWQESFTKAALTFSYNKFSSVYINERLD